MLTSVCWSTVFPDSMPPIAKSRVGTSLMCVRMYVRVRHRPFASMLNQEPTTPKPFLVHGLAGAFYNVD